MTTPETRYMSIDPRQLQKFMRTPGFVQSLSPTQLEGMDRRLLTARWAPNERVVYQAVKEGYTDLGSLPMATGLTSVQIQAALDSLTARGVVNLAG